MVNLIHSESGFDSLVRDVIRVGLCTACGTCIGVCPRASIVFSSDLEEPVLQGDCRPCGLCYAVCPGKEAQLSAIDRALFSRERVVDAEVLGIHKRKLIAYATDPAVRSGGGSGGCVSALLNYALDEGIISGAVVAGMNEAKPWIAEPKIATTPQEIAAAAKSKYAVVPNNAALNEAARRGLDRIGMVGVPCHVHGIRKLQLSDKSKKLARRVQFIIGLFCGGNFSHRVTEHSISRLTGVALEDVAKFEYRGGPESQDGQVTTRDGRVAIIPSEVRAKTNSTMRRERCMVCWDCFAEVADISVGDIYLAVGAVPRLPKYSAIIIRTKAGEALVDGAERRGYIRTSLLENSGFAYNAGLEKRMFAAYRLQERRRFSWPTPDFSYSIKYEPRAFIDRKAALRQQIAEIPEVRVWIAQNEAYQEQVRKLDSGILAALGKLT